MQQTGRTYIAIDLKSFYASVECMERGLDPLTTNLVVADASRTEKTICLAVSPSLKAYGISGRARLFEVVERVKEVNAERRRKAGCLSEKSFNANELAADPSREVDYLIAPPRMAKYIQVSTQIYNVYLKYIAPEDIHVYSIDEVMMDVTSYLETYHMTTRELAKTMILDVLRTTGITATAGIGSNLYLCKVAMDIMAKHVQPDKDGVRIAELDEMSYREQLWAHRPLTDFWRVGRGYAKKLEAIDIYTMGDVARCSIGSRTNTTMKNCSIECSASTLNSSSTTHGAGSRAGCRISRHTVRKRTASAPGRSCNARIPSRKHGWLYGRWRKPSRWICWKRSW